ncbi:MAG: hypothetical protein QOJ04_4003, partial [Caballeronia sp.]|nr:hypothetical protein [Caballeronia sp.]
VASFRESVLRVVATYALDEVPATVGVEA